MRQNFLANFETGYKKDQKATPRQLKDNLLHVLLKALSCIKKVVKVRDGSAIVEDFDHDSSTFFEIVTMSNRVNHRFTQGEFWDFLNILTLKTLNFCRYANMALNELHRVVDAIDDVVIKLFAGNNGGLR